MRSPQSDTRQTLLAQHSVHPTLGTHRVILAFSWLSAFPRFDGESTLLPQAGNAPRWAASATRVIDYR